VGDAARRLQPGRQVAEVGQYPGGRAIGADAATGGEDIAGEIAGHGVEDGVGGGGDAVDGVGVYSPSRILNKIKILHRDGNQRPGYKFPSKVVRVKAANNPYFIACISKTMTECCGSSKSRKIITIIKPNSVVSCCRS